MNRRKFVELAAIAPLARSALQRDTAVPAKPLVVMPDKARVYDTGRGETRILVDAEQSAGAWWLGSFVSEPGRKTSLHVHYSAEEQFYVVEGILSAWIDDKWLDLPAGSVATAPRKVPHALGNRSKEPVKFLVAGEPAGFENFFPDIEKLASQFTYGSPEFLAELAKVYKKLDSELLGPPPQG